MKLSILNQEIKNKIKKRRKVWNNKKEEKCGKVKNK